MQHVTINIDGMTCGGCVKSVTNALTQVSGVHQADVSLENHNATIRFDDSQTNSEALKQAIIEAGYNIV